MDTVHKQIRAIIDGIAADAGYTYKEIMAWDRRVPVVRARQLAMVTVARRFPYLSTTRLGVIFKRDYSTVIHALKLHNFRVSENGTYGFRQRYRKLRKVVGIPLTGSAPNEHI